MSEEFEGIEGRLLVEVQHECRLCILGCVKNLYLPPVVASPHRPGTGPSTQ